MLVLYWKLSNCGGMGGDEMPAHKHKDKLEREKTAREVAREKQQGMRPCDVYRKLNASKRIKKLGGLSYVAVLYYYHQCQAA